MKIKPLQWIEKTGMTYPPCDCHPRYCKCGYMQTTWEDSRNYFEIQWNESNSAPPARKFNIKPALGLKWEFHDTLESAQSRCQEVWDAWVLSLLDV